MGVGIALICVGILKPDLSNIFTYKPNPNVHMLESYVVDAPSNTDLLPYCESITDAIKSSNDSTRSSDSLKLSALYCDLATLISLDDEDMVIKDTAAIREANSIAGKMLKLDIKEKYPNLAEACGSLIVAAIGDDDIILNAEVREKSVEAFRALSWSFYEGSK